MSVRIVENDDISNTPIPGKKEVKGVVYIVMYGDMHYDSVVTVYYSLEDAKRYCGDSEDYYIVESNVF